MGGGDLSAAHLPASDMGDQRDRSRGCGSRPEARPGSPLTRLLGAQRRLHDVPLPAPAARRLRCVLVVPDRPHGRHVVPAHEPRRGADLGRLRQLPCRLERPAVPDRRQEHCVLRTACADLRLSDSARRGGPDERGAARARLVQRARLPAGRASRPSSPSCSGRRSTTAAPSASSTPCSAGSGSARIRGSSRSRGRCRRSFSSRPGRTQVRR